LESFNKKSTDVQEEYYAKNNISESEQIYNQRLLHKHYFLKLYTGYYQYRFNPVTDNWDVFDLLLEDDYFVNAIKTASDNIRDIYNLRNATYSSLGEIYETGNQYIDIRDGDIGRRRIINEIIEMFNGTDGMFKLTNVEFDKTVIDNISYLCENKAEYNDKVTGLVRCKSRIELMQEELGIKYKKQFADTMNTCDFINNLKSVLKQINNFTSGYLQSIKPICVKIEEDKPNKVDKTLNWSFNRSKSTQADNSLFYFMHSVPHLYAHHNLRQLTKSNGDGIKNDGITKIVIYPNLNKHSGRPTVTYTIYDQTGTITRTTKKPYINHNNKRLNNRKENNRIKVTNNKQQLYEQKLNIFDVVTPPIVDYAFNKVGAKLSTGVDNRVKLKLNVKNKGLPFYPNDHNQSSTPVGEITIYTPNMPHIITTTEPDLSITSSPDMEVPKYEYKINTTLVELYKKELSQVLGEIFKIKRQIFIKLFSLNGTEYFANKSYFTIPAPNNDNVQSRDRWIDIVLDLKMAVCIHYGITFHQDTADGQMMMTYRPKYNSISAPYIEPNKKDFYPTHCITVDYNQPHDYIDGIGSGGNDCISSDPATYQVNGNSPTQVRLYSI
jgi:hypothetical protein